MRSQAVEYFRGVVRELKNVKFPTEQEVKVTALAIAFVLAIAMTFVGVADFVISRLVKNLLGIL
ncbi:MAG: preprotein translocase subunit SecE [Rickettsiales bacterium]|jgi:preprotein translocase SecE subunit|nr:preprotein translocase subunit SecE [Rickettsiales bacterium]